MSWFHAWNLWFHGHQISLNVRIWDLRLLWWGRFADILAFVSGLSVVFELLGAHPLQVIGKKLTERAKRVRLMFRHAPVYARLVGKCNDVTTYLEIDIEAALKRHIPPPLREPEGAPEPHPVRTPEYRQLAGDVYRDVIAHHCGQSADKLCVHGRQLIRRRARKFIGETGTPTERETWKIDDDDLTSVLALLMAALCWLALAAGTIFVAVTLIMVLPAAWLAVLAAVGIVIIVFLALARAGSEIPLILLAALGGVPGVTRSFSLRPAYRRRRHRRAKVPPEEISHNHPRPWNKPFRYFFDWTGRRYYPFYKRPRHSATWRISAITAQYVLASLLLPPMRALGFILNREKPDHLLRWIFLGLLIVSFLPFIITQ
jgi:hypothetical protein